MTIKQNIFLITLFSLFVITQSVFADTVIITNVNSSANSGGNNVSSGQTIEKSATAEVFMETIIDGKTVNSFHKTDTNKDNTTSISESFIYKTKDSDVEDFEKVNAFLQKESLETLEKETKEFSEPLVSKKQEVSVEEKGLLVTIKHFFTYVFYLFT